MQQDQTDAVDHESDLSTHEESTALNAVSRSEALHLRNYDHQEAYDVDVAFVTYNGETVFQNHYYLVPGDVESESSVVSSGNYELRVRLDNSRLETLDCRIDSSPDHTAVIEIGNGAMALSEGLWR